jgi:ankyrin repeat protein
VSATKKADAFVIAQYGELQQFMEKFDIDKINEKNENGSSLLHLAIAGRKFDIALYLINSGIDVNQNYLPNTNLIYVLKTKLESHHWILPCRLVTTH